jgi:hypothetical protein
VAPLRGAAPCTAVEVAPVGRGLARITGSITSADGEEGRESFSLNQCRMSWM